MCETCVERVARGQGTPLSCVLGEEGVERGNNRGGGWDHHTEGGPIKR